MNYFPPPMVYPTPHPVYQQQQHQQQPYSGPDESVIGWIIELLLFLGMIALVIYYLSHPESPLKNIIDPETVRTAAERVGAPVPERENKFTTQNIIIAVLGGLLGFVLLFIFMRKFRIFLHDKLPENIYQPIEGTVYYIKDGALDTAANFLGKEEKKIGGRDRDSIGSEYDGLENLFDERDEETNVIEDIKDTSSASTKYITRKKLEKNIKGLSTKARKRVLNVFNKYYNKDGELKKIKVD